MGTFGNFSANAYTRVLGVMVWANETDYLYRLNLTIYNFTDTTSNLTFAQLAAGNTSGIIVTTDNDYSGTTIPVILPLQGNAAHWDLSDSANGRIYVNMTFDNTSSNFSSSANLSTQTPYVPNLNIWFNLSNNATHTHNAYFSFSLDNSFGALSTTINLTDRTVNNTANSSKIRVDAMPPNIEKAVTGDTDSNGYVDSLIVTFYDALNDSSLTNDCFNVNSSDGTVAVSTGTTANDTIIVLNWTSGQLQYTNTTPGYIYEYNTTCLLNDVVGNYLASNSTYTSLDGARPVFWACNSYDTDSDGRLNNVNCTMSEPLTTANTTGFTARVNYGPAVTSHSALAITGANGYATMNVLNITFDDLVWGTGNVSLIYDATKGSVNDTKQNATVSNGSITVSDIVSPVVWFGDSYDIDGDGSVDYINLSYTENLTGGNFSSAFTTANVSFGLDSSVGLHNLTVTSTRAHFNKVDFTFDDATANYGTGRLRIAYNTTGPVNDSSSNLAAANTNLNVSDNISAVLLSAYTVDRDFSGYLDGVRLNFSEGIGNYTWGSAQNAFNGSTNISVGASFSGALTLDPDASYDGVNDSQIFINFTGTTYNTSGVPPVNISVNSSTYITDLSGNNITKVLANVSIDKAAPVIWMKTTYDYNGSTYIDSINLTFSEVMNDSLCDNANFTIEGISPPYLWSLSTGTANDDTFMLGFHRAYLATNSRPTVNYTNVGGSGTTYTENCTDWAYNQLVANNSATGALDRAPPRIRSAIGSDATTRSSGIDSDDTIIITFSEPVNLTSGLTVNSLTTNASASVGAVMFLNDSTYSFGITNGTFDPANSTLTLSLNTSSSNVSVGNVMLFLNASFFDFNNNSATKDNKSNASLSGTFYSPLSDGGSGGGGGGGGATTEDEEEEATPTPTEESNLDDVLAEWETAAKEGAEAGAAAEETGAEGGAGAEEAAGPELGAEAAGTEQGVAAGTEQGDVSGSTVTTEGVGASLKAKLTTGKTAKIVSIILILVVLIGLVVVLKKKQD